MSGDAKTASIDYDACNGHGRCYMTAPDMFDCEDDGLPIVIGEVVGPAGVALLERAASNCPERAISIVSSLASQ